MNIHKNIAEAPYTLLCGDCLDLMMAIPDGSVDLIVTDPPYRCISGGRAGRENQPSGILTKNDGKLFDHNDIAPEDWFPEIYRVLKENAHCYVMSNLLNLAHFMTVAHDVGFKIHNLLVWKKNNATPNKWYMKNCEFTLFLYKGKAKFINDCGSKQVHEFRNIIGNKKHPTEKPVELMEFYILNSSGNGDIVLDPFMGCGSTGVACINTDRKFIGMEIDEKYFSQASDRISGACLCM